jgi:uncharacterized protein YaaR (DUF327 family)
MMIMDKIDSVGESFSYKSLQKKKRKKETPKTGRFSSLVRSISSKNDAGDSLEVGEEQTSQLEELMEDINELGDVLEKNPTLDNIKRYRERVKYFMKYLVAHVLDVEQKISGANILKRKKYTLITIIDQKLEDLSRDFLLRQKSNLDLLGRINEINGLLVDLLR